MKLQFWSYRQTKTLRDVGSSLYSRLYETWCFRLYGVQIYISVWQLIWDVTPVRLWDVSMVSLLLLLVVSVLEVNSIFRHVCNNIELCFVCESLFVLELCIKMSRTNKWNEKWIIRNTDLIQECAFEDNYSRVQKPCPGEIHTNTGRRSLTWLFIHQGL